MSPTPRIQAIITAGITLAITAIAACSQAMVDPSPETKDAVLAVATSAADTGGAAHPDPSIAGQAEQASNDRREADDDDGASQLRRFIGRQAGGIDKLRVPPDDAAIPLPPEDPTRPGRYRTTEAKRYLGKLLFHDPVRTARININEGQPLDLPAGTAFGGTVSASDPNIKKIADAQRQDTSCGSCHVGEAAGKAGQQLNFASGGEGRGYTDEHGNFFPRRRPQSILTKLRTEPIFPGDALVDALPTLADIFSVGGERVVTSPARFYHSPAVDALLETGRLDALDSVARPAPT